MGVGRAELPGCSLPGNGNPWSGGRADLQRTFKSILDRFGLAPDHPLQHWYS